MCRAPVNRPVLYVLAAAVVALLLPRAAFAQGGATVALGWDASTGTNVAGYMLYTGTVSGTYDQSEDVGPSTTGTLTDLTAGGTYYFVVTAYDEQGQQSTPSNEVSFTVPVSPVVSLACSGTSLTAPASVTLSASASETSGTIAQVEFFNGSALIGTATASPYTITWSGVPVGSYSLTAEAFDTSGNSTLSSAVTVTVAAPPVVNSMQVQSDGSLAFSVTSGDGDAGNDTYDVWVSADLQNWTLLQTVTATAGNFAITDPGASGVRYRFYKVSPP